VIGASIRGVLVSQIAISVGHASIRQVERASPDLLRRSRLVFNGNSGLNVDIIESYGIILALPSLRDHAADDRQAE
jgi:hypothetical protein